MGGVRLYRMFSSTLEMENAIRSYCADMRWSNLLLLHFSCYTPYHRHYIVYQHCLTCQNRPTQHNSTCTQQLVHLFIYSRVNNPSSCNSEFALQYCDSDKIP